MAFKFEKLKVWQESVELTGYIQEVSLKFPKDELYVLSSQIRRAADSISLNIAEGSTGQSDRSGVEVVECLYLAKRRKIISDEDFANIYNSLDGLIKRIQALRKSIE